MTYMIINLRTIIVITVTIIAILVNVSLFVKENPLSSNAQEEENETFLKGVDIPKDKYLHARVKVNSFELTADLAIKNDQRIKGLAIKDQLKENEGMLFIFEQPARYGFWMNGMKFPIDIIWLDGNGTIVHIEHNLQPCVSSFNCPTYIPDKDSLYVLETIAGFSQKHSLKIGTVIHFQLIN
jgi:uncharacterized protein